MIRVQSADALARVGPKHVSGEFIVKFRSDGERALGSCAHCLFEHHERFRDHLGDRFDSIDRLNQKYRVRSAAGIHPGRHATNLDEAKRMQREHVETMQRRFERRSHRAPSGVDPPDLTNIYVLHVPEEADIEEIVRAYASDPHVEYAQPNFRMKPLAFPDTPPNDTYYTNFRWDLNNTGQNILGSIGTPGADIDAPEAWASFGIDNLGDRVVVGVVDTGFDYKHPDLRRSDIAGLLLSKFPHLTNANVQTVIRNSTDDVGLVGYGTGRINAMSAHAEASSFVPGVPSISPVGFVAAALLMLLGVGAGLRSRG